MGKTKLTIMDDSIPQEEEKKKKPSKKAKQVEAAKSETDKAIDVVEQSEDTGNSEDSGAQQIHSEAQESASKPENSGPSGALQSDEQPKKKQKMGRAKPRSKKYQEVSKDLDRSKYLPVEEAVDLVKKLSYAKFNATIEAHINTVQTGLRGFISLPYGAGKKIRILAFGKGAEHSGADLVGSDETIEAINKGKIDFDLVITSPEWMPKLAKVAKILGPRGLMPNPKSGTITDDLKKIVESYQAGKTEYKTEPKAPIIHLALGKVNQPNEEIVANIKMLLMNLGKTKIRKVKLAPTMGPAVKVDLASI